MEYGFTKSLYSGQIKLIEDVTNAIENRKIAVVSSPTGTGKTLSLLCVATKYLSSIKNDDDDLFELLNSSTQEKTKIYYCSRTHSQLSQVMGELKACKNKYNSVILGSRKVYCVNPEVSKIKDIKTLNDKCKLMIRNDNCCYYNNSHYTSNSMDIEELKNLAKLENFCPYYHSKNKASECEIVFLPYNLLFTKEGRDSVNITLKNKILIVDEAHNIYDTVIQLNSAEVCWNDLKSILTAKGLSQELKIIIDKILNYKNKTIRVQDVISFLIDCKISNFNMLEMSEYIDRNRLAQKNDMKFLFEFSKLLKYLTFSDIYGRIFIDQLKIKFSCVNPKMYFEELNDCKSVIFAGGTMEPIAQLKNIFPELAYFNYPSVNTKFLSLIISETVNGKMINLNYSQRNEQLDDVLNTIIALSNPVITGGIIVFVPSNQILDMIKKSIKIKNFKRKLFFEGNMTFEEYKRSPEILFAVMGGTLSEGINFSDNLCRLLIIMGVPFPSKTIEIEEKVKFLKDYETLVAMKTVNQSFGRALRHKEDYAAIVFLDSRYVQLKQYLSPWIQPKTRICKVGEGIVSLHTFLKGQNEIN